MYQKHGNGTETRYSYADNNRALENRYDSLGWECNVRLVDDYVNNKSFCCDGGDFQLAESLGAQSATDTAPALYFYHPDHLGSTAMVTNEDGHITQNVVYIPYGEVFVEERNGSWASSYLFNAKELDEVTGLYYYGARYLDPTAAVWLSVDTKLEDYGGSSPYNYCMSNPVKLIDLDGMFEQDADGNWIAQTGDNAYTLAKAMNVTPSEAIGIMKAQGFEFTEGDKKVLLNVEDKVVSKENTLKMQARLSVFMEFVPEKYPNVPPLQNVYPEFYVLLARSPLKISFNSVLGFIKSERTDELQFGSCENQSYHTFRHMNEIDLNPKIVEKHIRSHFKTIKNSIKENKPFIIKIKEKDIQYTVYKLPNGKYNVGRIHEVKVKTP